MTYSFKNDKESLNFVISELIRMKVKLNDWEKTFINQIKYKIDTYENFKPSSKQLKCISIMWEKY